jgi:hypothetical protein
MLSFIIALLIVYGISLIIVQGTIFDGMKIQLSKWIDSLEGYLYPKEDKIFDLIEKNDSTIDPKLITMFNTLTSKIEGINPDTKNFQEVVALLDDTRNTIKKKVWGRRSSWIIKLIQKLLIKLQTLVGCMMCTSFWVGYFIFALTLVVDISIFGIPLSIITHVSPLNTAVSGFLVSCLFSGTTWIIHAIVDTIYSYRNN